MTLEELLSAPDPAKGYVWIVSDESEVTELRGHLESLIQEGNHIRKRTYQEKLLTWFFGEGFRDLWATHHTRNKAIPPLRIYNPASGEAIDVLPASEEEKQILLSMWREHFRGAPRQRPPSKEYHHIEQAVRYLRITDNNPMTRLRVQKHLRKRLGERVSARTIKKHLPEILGKLA